jgi:FtsH-binding integral membrane protein
MQPDNFPTNTSARAVSYDAGLRSYFQRIYNVMALGLVVTGLVAYGVASTPALMQVFFGNPLMRFIVIFAPLGFIFFGFTPARIQRMQSSQLNGLFYLFSALMGLSFSTIFIIYSGQSIARVFFITASMFAGTSIFGYATKKDLSSMGSFLFMGMWGIFIAMLANMFFHSAAVQFAVSLIGVVVFTGLIAWNTQNFKAIYSSSADRESTNKTATMAALSLYIDFINLFQFLLMLMGNRR